MRRLVSLCLVKQDSWVANGRAFQSRWQCDGRVCRRPWAELGWAGLAASWIFTVRSPNSKKTRVRVLLWLLEGCGSNGQGELYLPQDFAFVGSCTLSEYFLSSVVMQWCSLRCFVFGQFLWNGQHGWRSNAAVLEYHYWFHLQRALSNPVTCSRIYLAFQSVCSNKLTSTNRCDGVKQEA